MADTTLEQVEQLAKELSPEEQRLLARNLLQGLGDREIGYRPRANRSKDEIRRTLAQAWGAWGNKTVDEIDRELNEMRDKDWSRDWDKEPYLIITNVPTCVLPSLPGINDITFQK